jgi:DNA-binding transcriptional ArsR family regulator
MMSEYRLMKWSELEATMSPESRAKIDARVRQTMSRLRLSDIREAVGHTQVAIAAKLKLGQASVSKIESAADMYLSTLRRYIEALGGELVVSAQFPEGTVVPIDSLSSTTKARKKRATAKKKALGKKVLGKKLPATKSTATKSAATESTASKSATKPTRARSKSTRSNSTR